ncbi:MAG: DEAD/DEAH box helicase [Ignavibacteria bacterium]|nr:DEAD/DEAH box helicase [Ignavibacteria bacterium]
MKDLIPDHLKKMINSSSHESVILVYKGFPVHFLMDLNTKIPHINNLSFLDERNLIDIGSIKDNFLNLLMALNKPSDKLQFMIFEEFLLLPSKSLSLIPAKFRLIKNNFYDSYPNQTNQTYVDIEDCINKDIPIKENELFDLFYSDSKELVGVNCIQHIDFEVDLEKNGVETIDFFNPEEVELPELKDCTSDTSTLIQFKSADDSYVSLKLGLFMNQVPESVELLVDEKIFHIPQDLSELKILYTILRSANSSVTLYKQHREFTKRWRPELEIILKKHWNHTATFKSLKIFEDPDTSSRLTEVSQGAIAEHIVRQVELAKANLHFQDIFLTAPTGAGKSLLFQLPAIYLADSNELNSVTLVISPLKALMSDQINSLKESRKFHNCAFLNSDLSLIERQSIIEKTMHGDISLLYMSPELLLSYDIKTFLGERDLGLLIVDEAHLVSTWGRDFRVDYWFLGNYIRKLRRGSTLKGLAKNNLKTYRFPVVALTATAVYSGTDDMVYETIGSLNMQNCSLYIGKIRRNEISFHYKELKASAHELTKINRTSTRIKDFVKSGKKSIFYFPWISQVEDVYRVLSTRSRALVRRYHSRLTSEERAESVRSYKLGTAKCVLATKAFGMGIDIGDIEIVYHHAPSGSLADYVQEIGRAARIPGIEGRAMLDFNPKDLKYTRILYGLSSLKQFQVDSVLKKVNKLYSLKGNRNMLVSIDDFKYLFVNDTNPEQKVKSALLVIEKDLLAKYGYNVLIVRPKSLFSTVFGSATLNDFLEIKAKYGELVSEVTKIKYDKQKIVVNGDTIIIRENEDVKFFKISLDGLWEKHYPDQSFPSIKYKYFSKALIPNLEPVLKMQIYFNRDISESQKKLEQGLQVLETTLLHFSGHYFSKEELTKKLNESIQKESNCRKLADLLTVFYCNNGQSNRSSQYDSVNDNFLQSKTIGSELKYRIVNYAFGKVRSAVMKTFVLLFGCMNEQSREYVGYISIDPRSSKGRLKLAYLLEIFDLATYEISGGELPQLFVRINDPLKISQLCKAKYRNSIVADVERRHKTSMEIMNYFFQTEMTDSQRWHYIEDYFLGKEVPTMELEKSTGKRKRSGDSA